MKVYPLSPLTSTEIASQKWPKICDGPGRPSGLFTVTCMPLANGSNPAELDLGVQAFSLLKRVEHPHNSTYLGETTERKK
jgi:hypothetical protein